MTRNGHRIVALYGGCALAALVACQCVKLDEGLDYRCGDGGACDRTRVCIDGFCRLPPDAGGEDAGEDGTDAAVAWTFENPLSGGRDLYAIHGAGSNNMLAVGERGAVLRWRRVRWEVEDLGVETGLEGVWLAIDGTGYVVGDGGAVLRWDGIEWKALPVPAARPYDLHAVSGNLVGSAVLLAGDHETIQAVDSTGRHDKVGSTDWRLSDGGVAAIRGIWVNSLSDGWAVGEEGAVFSANALELYTPLTPPDGGTLNAVYGPGGNAWMVGEHGRLLRAITSTSIGWSESNLGGDTALRAVTGEPGTSPPQIWIVGERGAIFRSDAGGFEQVDAGVHLELRGVFSPTAGEVWAVGQYGTIVRLQGGQWHDVIGGVTRHLHGVSGTTDMDVLAVGDDMTVLARADGGWAPVYQNPDFGNATASWGDGRGRAWVVGDGGVIVELESNQYKIHSLTFQVLRGIWGVGSGTGELWAVGGRTAGVIFRADVDPGTGWRTDPFTGEPLNGVWGTTLDDLRVIGSGGTIYRRGPASWETEASLGGTLNAIWGSGPDDIWAVGSEGVVAHWTGSGWSAGSVGKVNLLAVRGRSATDVWAVGTEGAAVRWNGRRWIRVPVPTTRDLTGVAFGADGGVWVVGADGTILGAAE